MVGRQNPREFGIGEVDSLAGQGMVGRQNFGDFMQFYLVSLAGQGMVGRQNYWHRVEMGEQV